MTNHSSAKATRIIIALTFTVACLGLWICLGVMDNTLKYHFPRAPMPNLTRWCINSRPMLLIFPIPALANAIIGAFRKTSSSEHLTFFASLLALVFVFLFFIVAIAMLLPWTPILETA